MGLLNLPWLETHQEFSISRDGKGSFSFTITWEAAELHVGSDAVAVLPSLQHHKNSSASALMRDLRSWLLSTFIVRTEIHSQAWKCLDNDTHIFLLWSLLAAGFSDYSLSKETQLKFSVLATLLLLNTWNLVMGTAVVQMWLGGWKENRESTYSPLADVHLGAHCTQLIFKGRGMMLSLFPAGNSSWHPADGTSGELFPRLALHRAALRGRGEGAGTWHPWPERREVGRVWLTAVSGDLG